MPTRIYDQAKLTADLEWRLIYVGSAQSEDYDQELDSCMGESPETIRCLYADLAFVLILVSI